MTRPVVDDELLKERLDQMAAVTLSECVDGREIRDKPPEYHSGHCPVFKNWRAAVRAARVAQAGGGTRP